MLIEHEHNKDYVGNAIQVKNWKEIYELLV
jgi:hypothetical protein